MMVDAKGGRRAGVLVAALLLLTALPIPSHAEVMDRNGAATQWAQMILKEQGFYQGRPTSKLDDQTVAGLRQYQKKYGLPVTGKLDDATADHMRDHRPVDKTVANLADPQSRAHLAQPILPEREAQPKAAMGSASVQQSGAEQGSAVLGFSHPGAGVNTGAGANAGAAPAAPAISGPVAGKIQADDGEAAPSQDAPQAAQRAAVEMPAADMNGGQGDGFNPAAAPDWVRAALLGALAVLLLVMAGVWWWSGRPPARTVQAPTPVRAPRDGIRREPSLGDDAPLSMGDGRLEPRFQDRASAARSRGRG